MIGLGFSQSPLVLEPLTTPRYLLPLATELGQVLGKVAQSSVSFTFVLPFFCSGIVIGSQA